MTPPPPPPECLLPVISSDSRQQSPAFFDIDSSAPGDFVHPVLFNNETWPHGHRAEIIWVFFKGDAKNRHQPGHPFEMPFAQETLFAIDLLDAGTNLTLRNVMPPSNPTSFELAGLPFDYDRTGTGRQQHMLSIHSFENNDLCRTNTFGLMIYHWTVPTDLCTTTTTTTAAKYRFQLSTSDSDRRSVGGGSGRYELLGEEGGEGGEGVGEE